MASGGRSVHGRTSSRAPAIPLTQGENDMNPIRRLTAAVAFCFSMAGLANPPPPSTFTVTPIKAAEYPLSCNGLSKPIVVKAWDMLFNSRVDEAREELKLAVAADPKCVVARSYLGTLTPGVEGKQLFDDALKEIAGLNEVERLDLQAMEAQRNADPEKAFTLARKMAELAPNVFVVNLALAHYAQDLMKWNEAGDADAAFRMFRNFDGAGANFGDTSVSATTSDLATATAYASLDSVNTGRVVMVIVNKATVAKTAALSVTNPLSLTRAEVYQLTSASAAPVRGTDVTTTTPNSFRLSLPAMSVTTLLLRP
jgi:hypothetical protein